MRRRIHFLLMAAPLMALFVLSGASAAAAGQDDQLQRLHSALNMLDQEQRAIYQQFQMVQALRRSSPQPFYGATMLVVPSGEIANYDEAVAAQDRLIRRSNELAEQASQLVTRYGEIEEEKKPLQQQILRLTNGNK
jgi:hypothetical protein